MLDQEKKNLEIINSGNRNNGQDMARAETNIRKLEEELKYVCGEVNTKILFFFFLFCILLIEKKLIINLTSTNIFIYLLFIIF